ncbi:hypothetical protein BOO69_19155 (plasmid) [Sulfitobacter alexandrii]|uniref:YdbS-like PH domain-containing protein n=1 Tax=Sulfitobacter alexandrii TaxID=1917485 RepID=A0A1J0WN31_9RHOB|nr:photosynthetic complex putative assembly protein PuhB [Sulfitobacter alexandrii]APE45677.1 hypothetical protein BOO69_19155 [Sulfitobacter alexandrii]
MHHDDFKFEPVHGLPEALPADEHILWQGRPDSLRLAIEAWKLRWVLGYFAALAAIRVILSTGFAPLPQALLTGIPFIVAGTLAALVILGMATVQARSTVYTLTNKRVAMRIGAALTMTLNLPYVCIGNAAALVRRNGTGTISFELIGDTRLSYIMTWPHVRPWQIRRAQPALRAIPDAAKVAAIFAEAAETRVSQPKVAKLAPDQGATAPIAAE